MVIFKGKLKLAKKLLVYFAVIVVLYKVLNCLSLNLIIYLLKNFKFELFSNLIALFRLTNQQQANIQFVLVKALQFFLV